MDPGQGVDVAIRQIVAEELDIAVERVAIVMGDTARTATRAAPPAAPASSAAASPCATPAPRRAACCSICVATSRRARRCTAGAGRRRLCTADPTRQVSYGELIGDRHFDVPMQWNGVYGNGLVARGRAEPKTPTDYHVVGTRFRAPTSRRRSSPGTNSSPIFVCPACCTPAWSAPRLPAACRQRRRSIDRRHPRRARRLEAGFPRRRRPARMGRHPRRPRAEGHLVAGRSRRSPTPPRCTTTCAPPRRSRARSR